ncbi:MAG: STAS domain-containing protein [Xylanivirga thermophila]|uniref:STAS domain-containing protein n=1 Tax=Xylanivirga thermophila TaxID=2496273 RepID=UPI0013EBF215|nr:STAS domain-containing protein [Xylanivirga thermophila]
MQIYREGSTVFIKPKDEISFSTVILVKNKIYDFLNADDKVIELDLSDVEFMDSAGLGMLISLVKIMKARGGKLVVAYPQLGVQKLLEMTKMDSIMDIRKTPEQTTGSWKDFD